MMKKICLVNFMYAIAFMSLFTACDDNDYDGPEPDEVTANYSNKLAYGDRANLALTYSGNTLIGKSVYFKTSDTKTAEMTLINVLPHDTLARIEGIPLSPNGTGGYAFSGNGMGTTTGTTFKYDGTVTDGKLTVNLSDVNIARNELTSNGTWSMVHKKTPTVDKIDTTWIQAGDRLLPKVNRYTTYYTPTYGEMGGELLGMAYGFFLKGILDDAIDPLLNTITFRPDGNIVAAYKENEKWVDSPINLASYYVKDDSLLYVTPNVDMIIRQIRLNQANTKAAGDSINVTESLGKIYALLNRWSTTGIRLVIREQSKEYNNIHNRFAGDVILVVKKEEVKDLFALLDIAEILINKQIPGASTKPLNKLLKDFGIQIPPEFSFVEDLLGQLTLDMVLKQLSSDLNVGEFELGIYLNK